MFFKYMEDIFAARQSEITPKSKKERQLDLSETIEQSFE